MPIKHLKASVIFFFTIYSSLSFAVDAGDVLKQIERSQEENPQLKKPPQLDEAPVLKTKSQGQSFEVKHFTFEGNSLIPSEELEAHLQRFKGNNITLDDLNEAKNSIVLYYKSKGFIVQTSLPKQDITDGDVNITIVEARSGGASLDINPEIVYHVKPKIIEDIINARNPKNDPLNLNKLDSSVLIANDLPGIRVKSTLKVGAQTGQSTPSISLENEPWINLKASVDNYGARATGRVRYIAAGSLLSPLKLGDRFDTIYMHTSGIEYLKLGYSIPVGNYGLRIGLNGSALDYNVVENITSVGAKGSSETIQIEASYPLVRTRLANLKLNSSFDARHFKNEDNLQGKVSEYRVNSFTAGFSGDLINRYFDGGQTVGSVNLDIGKPDYDNSPSAFQAAQMQNKVDSQFSRIRLNLNHIQFMRDDLSIILKMDGQYASDNLDSSQKIYLGGYSGVRAYPLSEGSGSKGFIINAEIKKQLPLSLTLTGFYDFGYAKQYTDQTGSNGSPIFNGQRNSFNLKGAGVSIDWVGPYNSVFSASWSRRIGDNPNPQANGADIDGNHSSNFYWLKITTSY